MAWIVSEEIDKEMYRISGIVRTGYGDIAGACKRHAEICRKYAGAAVVKMPQNDEKSRQAAATEARRQMAVDAERDAMRTIVPMNLDILNGAVIGLIFGVTPKTGADRLRTWAEHGLVETIGMSQNPPYNRLYVLTDKAKETQW